MPKYKNVSKRTVRFRAAKDSDKPHVKKVYEVAAGKSIEVPVEVSHGQLEPVKKEQ